MLEIIVSVVGIPFVCTLITNVYPYTKRTARNAKRS